MTVAAAVFAALVLGFAVTARWLSRVYVTAPITFVAAGAVISAVTPSMAADVTEFVKVLAEVTLALILFHDAAQVRPRQIEADRGSILRLLLVGLPLSAVPHLTSNPNPVAMGNQGSRLEIAVNRPVSRFAIDPAQFRELLGPRQVHIGSS